MTSRSLWGALALAMSVAACGPRAPDCGPMLEYDRASRRCVCHGTFVCVTPDDCECLPADGGAGSVLADAGLTADAGSEDRECAASETLCDELCVDMRSDEEHCGGCSHACLPGETCTDAACEDLVVQLAAGSAHTCALRGSGSIWCWGFGSDGQLGNGERAMSREAVRVGVIGDAIAISAASEFTFTPDTSSYTCALRRDGTVWCWGKNTYGQLGDGSHASHDMPVRVPGIAGALAIATGHAVACAIIADRSIVCWGGSETEVVAPHAVLGLTGIAELSGGVLMIARDVADRVFSWNPDDVDLVRQEWPEVQPARTVAAGVSGTCALDSGGIPFCIGMPECVGVLDGKFVMFPTEVAAAGNGFTALSTGAEDVCAVDALGVVCWGRRDLVVWGRDARVQVAVPPVRVGGTRGATQVAVGNQYACVLMDNRPYCWGGNAYGELGNGTAEGSGVPLPVRGLFD